MKKLALGIGILFLIALAMPAFAGDNGAEVGKDVSCSIFTGDYGGGGITASDSQYVINGNNFKLTCHGQIANTFIFPVKAVKINEVTNPLTSCWVKGLKADFFNTVITPSGQVTLTCHGKIV